ncbi:MAG: 16S rRNA (guanine(966)-N(2))-methyltransferase RsmD [Desulfobulbaceae bacterium]|nr:16S rRNA (guanine(966)-N(2))-methyltransferase RsmD [Desulfobulbaceae bacterium]
MRIISGVAGGRRLAAPKADSRAIRPTADRAREALFSILAKRLPDAKVLDLFAGTGALGLEALSRGAARAVFVDCGQEALTLIEENIRHCGFTPEQARVIRRDLRHGLPKEIIGEHFDVIFLDPPYDQNLADQTLAILSRMPIHAALIVAEERHKRRLATRYGQYFLKDRRRYGESAFWFFAPEGTADVDSDNEISMGLMPRSHRSELASARRSNSPECRPG